MGKYFTRVVRNLTYEQDFRIFGVPGNYNYWTIQGHFSEEMKYKKT